MLPSRVAQLPCDGAPEFGYPHLGRVGNLAEAPHLHSHCQFCRATSQPGISQLTGSMPLQFFMPSIQAAASSLAIQISNAPVHAKDEIEGVIAAQARNPGGGLIAMPDSFNLVNREPIIALAPATECRRSITIAFLRNQAA
jgi:hypothetical protein